jgi:high-affinity iron transporter
MKSTFLRLFFTFILGLFGVTDGWTSVKASGGGSTAGAVPAASPRLLVHLLDYLARDYGGAVSQGKVSNPTEYQEQVELVQTAVRTGAALPQIREHAEIQKSLDELKNRILKMEDPKLVTDLAREIQGQVTQIAGLETAPSQWPDLSRAHQLFQQNCTTCHGREGRGDGPAAMGLEPRPADFHKEDRMRQLTPLQAFNAIRIGIPGTAMSPFSSLSDQDVWDLAFYVISLRHENTRAGLTPNELKKYEPLLSQTPLSFLSTSTDEDLLKKWSAVPKEEQQKILSFLRLRSGEGAGSLHLARDYLQEAFEDFKSGNLEGARHMALIAYLEGVEPIEARLRLLNGAVVAEMEQRMMDVRRMIEEKKSVEQLSQAMQQARLSLDRAEQLLNQNPPSLWFVFVMTGSILLREGFEAVLIIVAILGVLRILGERRAVLWIHGGWILALLCGLAVWFVSEWLIRMGGTRREMMEGVTTLLAVAVLLYVGFWLHSKTEIHRWTSFIDGKTKRALKEGSLFSLAFISFMAVFREAFETVLFLQALSLEGGTAAKSAMAMGVAVSLALVLILAFFLLRYSVRIPIRKLFNISSGLMAVLAVILTGKGIHAFQEMGWIHATASPLPLRFDLLGLYPTLETLIPQGLLVLLVVALWIYGKKPPLKTASLKSA